MYSVATVSGTCYGVNDSVLKRWLLNLGVDDATIAVVLDISPNESTTIQVTKAA
jgi:hypothetical protein